MFRVILWYSGALALISILSRMPEQTCAKLFATARLYDKEGATTNIR